jgi:hypothetical protein
VYPYKYIYTHHSTMANSNFNDQNGIFSNILKNSTSFTRNFYLFFEISIFWKKIINVQATKGTWPLHMICDYTNVVWLFGIVDKYPTTYQLGYIPMLVVSPNQVSTKASTHVSYVSWTWDLWWFWALCNIGDPMSIDSWFVCASWTLDLWFCQHSHFDHLMFNTYFMNIGFTSS